MRKLEKGRTLVAKDRQWVDLVVAGATDVGAYQEVFGCSYDNAKKNAWRMRNKMPVLTALEVGFMQSDEARALSKKQRLGRLARIIGTGKDRDAIRAIDIYSKLEGDYKSIGEGDTNEGRKALMDLLGEAQHESRRKQSSS